MTLLGKDEHAYHADHLAGGAFPLLLIAVVAVSYLALARRRSAEPRGWNFGRTTAFLGGVALLALGFGAQSSPYPPGTLPAHMYQHLLVGMYAPIGLVLGAPMTLLLRSLPRRHGRRIGHLMRSRSVHVLAHPVTALAMNLGGLVVLYFTPLYAAAEVTPMLHQLITVHFLVTGTLFVWAIAGPDPAPRRPSVPARLVVLGIAIAGHAILSQLLYAGLFVRVPALPAELRQAGELMYYAGDIAELILAFALVSTWRPNPRGTWGRHGGGGTVSKRFTALTSG
ncbi:MAG: cytochrome c oxidase assembly protein [Cryobacterium sp.]|jgi:putative membrane protein|nr:cytochrome c oxidase assembly protein [Cryobacterium sp.]